jgi:hypothetical protein
LRLLLRGRLNAKVFQAVMVSPVWLTWELRFRRSSFRKYDSIMFKQLILATVGRCVGISNLSLDWWDFFNWNFAHRVFAVHQIQSSHDSKDFRPNPAIPHWIPLKLGDSADWFLLSFSKSWRGNDQVAITVLETVPVVIWYSETYCALLVISGPKRTNQIVRTGRSYHLTGPESMPANIYLARCHSSD